MELDNVVYNYVQEGKRLFLELQGIRMRESVVEQMRTSADKSCHIGGCFSLVIPMTTLYFGEYLRSNPKNPLWEYRDRVILSKGHSCALLYSILAELGFFPREELINTRSLNSRLRGHPGPSVPGVETSTGILGQGLSFSVGVAYVLKYLKRIDSKVYTFLSDGEMQAGQTWEALMAASKYKVDNLCAILDYNKYQAADRTDVIMPLGNLRAKLEAFGWEVIEIDGRSYEEAMNAFHKWQIKQKNGRATMIVSDTIKGYGGSMLMRSHKTAITDKRAKEELLLLKKRRKSQVNRIINFYRQIKQLEKEVSSEVLEKVEKFGIKLGFEFKDDDIIREYKPWVKPIKSESRSSKITCDESLLMNLEKGNKYRCDAVVTNAMEVFARTSDKVVSIDADLGKISGLTEGIAKVDPERALDVGVAEANMVTMGSAFATEGYNVFTSTFCVLFPLTPVRIVNLAHIERLEAQEAGWMPRGYGLDITYLATAEDMDTRTNGATHMSTEDSIQLGETPGMKIVNISCPRQLQAVLKYIIEGDKGPVYVRMLRAPVEVIYDQDYQFKINKAYNLRESNSHVVTVFTSGRQVHEVLKAYEILKRKGIYIKVVDMPSIDRDAFRLASSSNKPIIIAEQNSGYLYTEACRTISSDRIIAINTRDKQGRPQFVHSGTYEELLKKYDLSANSLVKIVERKVKTK